MTARMVTEAEFAASLDRLDFLKSPPRLAVAVSGGGDSMALAVLADAWARARGGRILAFTVDHGLRAASAHEAQYVHDVLTARGIAHETLVWRGDKPASGLQAAARDARYDLLLQACRLRGFSVLMLAHNAEDQAETFWMRLSHGSGIDGLAAMAPCRVVGCVTIVRPCLSFTRAQLRATCVSAGVEWIEDPSNTNDRFLRVRLRGFEDVLAAEGLTPARLAQTVQKFHDAQDALEHFTDQAAATVLRFHDEGYVRLDLGAWAAMPRDIQRRLLVRALTSVAPAPYPPRFAQVELLRTSLLSPGFAGQTLGGCDIAVAEGFALFIREAASVSGRLPVVTGTVWDGRFRLGGTLPLVDIGALGDDGLSVLKGSAVNNPILQQKIAALPAKMRRMLPSFWKEGQLLAVPHLDYYANDRPDLRALTLDFVSVV